MIRTAVVTMLLMSLACVRNGARPTGAPLASHAFENRDGLPVMTVRMDDGQPRKFLLDTGASPCVVDSALAAASGIESVVEDRERQGGAGAFRSRVTRAPVRVRIGIEVLTCRETIVLDLSGFTDAVGTELGGILGGDFFRGRVVAIDYDRERIDIHERATYDRAGTPPIPIRIERNRPYLTAQLSVPGGPQDSPRELLIDTGSRDHVDDKLLAESSETLGTGSATGLGTGASIATGRFSRVRIGTHEFRDVPGVVPNVPIVGTGILARFNLVFDYDGGWMILQARQRNP
jgi:hypothetical protein